MALLEMVISAIVKMVVEGVWDKTRRREMVIRVLRKVGLDPDVPPADFDGVYAYTLVEYGIDKPRPVLDFFRHDLIKKAFEQSFDKRDPSILDKEAESFLDWHKVGNELRLLDIDPRREFSTFTAIFNEIADRARTVPEVRVDQKLVDIHEAVQIVLARLEPLEGLAKLRDEVEKLKEGLRAPMLFRYFMTLEEYLIGPERRFPKANDFREGLVHLPKGYAAVVQRWLRDTGRCLLVGRSAAGKTGFAIALGRSLQEAKGYEIFYGDARRAQQGDGRAWYHTVRANDHKRALYILDNCHLAPEEVSEFCFQWMGKAPEHAQAILISLPRIGEAEERETWSEDYFDRWADVTVLVKSEGIYRSVIENYAAAYCQDPDRYVPLEDDWAQNASLLEAQHSHNLVASKSRLETWRDIGGRLSGVPREGVLEMLARRYLPDVERALPALCALWKYEILTHNVFVEMALPQNEVKQLEDRHLLDHAMITGYGVVYQSLFHPEEAREVFEASIYRKRGDVNAKLVEAETLGALRAYLKVKPPNYVWVYSRLYREGEIAIQRRLLADRDLQECAASQFDMGRPPDIALYLYSLSIVDVSRSRELFHEFLKSTGVDGVRSRLLQCNLWGIQFTLYYLKKLDTEIVKDILAGIKPQSLAEKGTREHFLGIIESHSSLPGPWISRTMAVEARPDERC